ncbi:MAG: TetR/AcrR family transcriptional regulator [Thermodesulfobacteriota bacterium]|nr:TetR/AcrR family transcriptional regulator [Thermodesulfobacteriota bacterium]
MHSANPKSKTEILKIAIPLFAREGFSGISMRRLADEVGFNAASLYHHFPDKETLYIATIKYAFADKAQRLTEPLTMSAPPRERLKLLITRLCQQTHDDPDFSRLVQREILKGDEKRLELVAKEVFQNMFQGISELCRELGPDYDAHLLTFSIIGLVVYHYQTAPIRLFLPGGKAEHNDPEVVAHHVTALLLHGFRPPAG